jgi:hypothetical protein
MAELLQPDPCARHGLAARVPHQDRAIAFAVPFNALAALSNDLGVGRLVFLLIRAPSGMAKQEGGGASPGLKECSTIHGDSR